MALPSTTGPEPRKLGRYELVKELATSSAGASWLARVAGSSPEAEGEPNELTLHKIHKHMAKAPSVVEGFLTQAQAAKKLAHANVLSVLDAGVIEGEPYFVTEHAGESLASIVRSVGTDGLPIPVALRISLDLLEGFAAAHGADPPMGHGEIGPWCIYVGADGVTRVSGFGIDQAFWRFGAHYVKNLDRLSYAAPERVRAMSSTLGQELSVADEQSDLFSAAAVVFELLTKQRLFPSKMEAAVVQKVLTSAIPSVSSMRAELGAEIDEALKGALARDRGARTKTFDDFITALEGAGPDLIGSHEAVAELAKLAKSNAAKPGVGLRAAAPAAPRATLAQGSAGATPAPGPVASALAAKSSTGTSSPGMPAVSGAAAPAAPQRTAPGVGPSNGAAPPVRPKGTLPGAGGPVIPKPSPSKPGAPPPRAAGKTLLDSTRTSSLELGDGDLVVEDSKDAAATLPHVPSLPDEAPTAPLAKDAAKPGGAGTEVPLPGAPAAKRPRPRAATLMGLQAPEDDGGADAAQAALSPIVVPSPARKDSPAPLRRVPPPPAADKSAEKPAAAAEKGRAVLRPAKKGAVDRVHPGAVLEAEGASYEMIAPVARGGMAVVWAAREVGSPTSPTNKLGKLVAVKTMLPELYDDEEFEHMFLDESRVAAKIQHKNVAGILGLGRAEELLYLVMEWVDGETLTSVQLAAKGPDASASAPATGMPGPIVLRIAADIASGLHAAHELRDDAGHSLELVHRDVSPANVLIDRHGEVKIVDFGIAKSKGRLHVTRASGLVKGKTPYLSPEQIGGLPIDRRSDLFSLGVLLYVLATGKHPFRGETEIQTLENIAINTPVPPTQLVASIPEGLEKIILRLLQKDAKQRFATAADVEAEVLAVEKTLEKPATHADVAAFVMSVVGDKLNQRLNMLEAAVEAFGNHTPKPVLDGADARAGAKGLADEPTADERGASTSRPRKIAVAEASDAVVTENGAHTSGEEAANLLAPGFPAPAKLPQIDLPGGDKGELAASASAEEVAPNFSDLADQEAVDVPRGQGSGMHLAKLIGIGVAVGLVVIGGIELFRHMSSSPTASTATATASVAAPAPTPKPTQAATPTAEPTTVAPTPPPTATATAAAPTSEPTPPATQAPPTPPTTRPVTPPTHPPYTPPGPGPGPRPPPTRPNPPRPPPTFNPNTL